MSKNESTSELCSTCGCLRRPNEVQSILDQLPEGCYVRQKLLRKILPFSSATLWRKVRAGQFPRPYKLSERVTAWRVDDVRAWFVKNGLAT